jgi:sulfoxide reductase heme-binding subunit YedZ
MSKLAKTLNSTYFLWLLLAIPLAFITARYMLGATYYGEYMHASGEFSARLLLVTLAITPLRLLWPKQRWTQWLMQRRRYLGVAAFAYAVPHLFAYLAKLGQMAEVISDGVDPGIWTGWLALLLFLPLAATSNGLSVRALGRNWKVLHRLVYVAAAFTFIHWVLVAFDPVPGLIHGGILAGLEGYRLYRTQLGQSD